MTDADAVRSPLADELRAVVAGLQHARRQIDADGVAGVDALPARLEACVQRIDGLERSARDAVRPLMLALVDELERTIAAFDEERRDLAARLRSASRGLAADAAYRQAGGRRP